MYERLALVWKGTGLELPWGVTGFGRGGLGSSAQGFSHVAGSDLSPLRAPGKLPLLASQAGFPTWKTFFPTSLCVDHDIRGSPLIIAGLGLTCFIYAIFCHLFIPNFCVLSAPRNEPKANK